MPEMEFIQLEKGDICAILLLTKSIISTAYSLKNHIISFRTPNSEEKKMIPSTKIQVNLRPINIRF